jgi:hypothetical protein
MMRLSALLLVWSTTMWHVAAQLPSNDFFADRISLNGTNVTAVGNNLNASDEPGELTASDLVTLSHSLWYSWTAPESGIVRARVVAADSDQMVTFYRGESLNALAMVSYPGVDSGNISVHAGDRFEIATQTYQVATGSAGRFGEFSLKLESFAPEFGSTNDNFSDAIAIETLQYSTRGFIAYASREVGEPTEPPDIFTGQGRTLWWSFTPEESGALVAQAAATGFAPRLVAYRGASLTTLEYLAMDNIKIQTIPGNKYWLQLTTLDGTSPGNDSFTLETTFFPRQTNDAFTSSIHLEGATNSVSAWLVSPTREIGEPAVTSGALGTVWWSWAAPEDGRAVITPKWIIGAFSSGATKLEVYEGPTVDRLHRAPSRRQSPDGPILFSAKAGAIYHIQVWARENNTQEEIGFNIELTPFGPATNDNFEQASSFDRQPKSTLGASREIPEPEHRGGGPNKSLWWKFTAGENLSGTSVRVGFGTLTNVTVAVYQGESIEALKLVKKGIDAATFQTWASERYYVAAEVPLNADGDIALDFQRGTRNSLTREIAGNLVRDPSFEIFYDGGWNGPMAGRVNETAPDGRNHASAGMDGIWQEIATIPGEAYRLQFVYSAEQEYDGELTVKFGEEALQIAVPWIQRDWKSFEHVFVASNTVTRLEFVSRDYLINLDQVVLVQLNQPPKLVSEPVNATAFAGGPAVFHAGITGAEPLTRQWFFNDELIANQTNSTLRFNAVSAANAGIYYVIATNAFGVAESGRVTLTVESAASPQFVLQPQSDTVFAGQYLVLQAAAVGTPPLSYQWFKDKVEIANATEAALIFPSFGPGDIGSYTVKVSNGGETATSLPAFLGLATATPEGGGVISFANSWRTFNGEVVIPVFDVDGVTRLAGSNYVAQLYAGVTKESLRPIGEPRPFLTGFSYGLWNPGPVILTYIKPGVVFFAQARVWDQRDGASYETARALGGRFGRSEILSLWSEEWPEPLTVFAGAPMNGLQSFSLQAGLPNFITGRLEMVEQSSDGTVTWRVTGAAGFRYLVERQTDGASWEPFKVVEAQNGTATFTDTTETQASIQIYRARMLD